MEAPVDEKVSQTIVMSGQGGKKSKRKQKKQQIQLQQFELQQKQLQEKILQKKTLGASLIKESFDQYFLPKAGPGAAQKQPLINFEDEL